MIDVSGVFTGELLDDVPLIAGDRIIIPEREIIQSELVRPSQITPRRFQSSCLTYRFLTLGETSRCNKSPTVPASPTPSLLENASAVPPQLTPDGEPP
uniref:Uncharacterized protein n=1 Tax=Desertifilum tharense IPPAS B-1220 TaxID=1781255 RepID=A0ACD5GVM7_9CYAN